MMENYDQQVEINRNPNLPYIFNHRYRISIIGGSKSGKNNTLLKLIIHERPNVGKFIYTSKIHLNQSINYFPTEEKK